MGIRKILLNLYGKVVCLYNDNQVSEPLSKRDRAHRQYSARLTRWLGRRARLDISTQYKAGKNLEVTHCFITHPTENASTKENYVEEYCIISRTDFFTKP